MSDRGSRRTLPFHVQVTAKEARAGFPYFDHHDAVSVLWSKKWRPPCVAGIYPFFDGSIEDFDSIFETLISLSGDDPSFLHQPDSYAAPFLPAGDALVSRADAALAAGWHEDARALYLRGAAVYRIARYPVVRSALSQDAWDKGKSAFEAGAAMLDPPNHPVAMVVSVNMVEIPV